MIPPSTSNLDPPIIFEEIGGFLLGIPKCNLNIKIKTPERLSSSFSFLLVS